MILLTGFEPFGTYTTNPSGEVAKALDGRVFGAEVVRGVVLPVHHREAALAVTCLLDEVAPRAIVHVGLAGGRARIALERLAVNVMDFEIADNAGYRAAGEACMPGGPVAYFSTLPLGAILDALVAEGVPAYLSSSAGTYLCNQTMYTTRDLLERRGLTIPAGFIHLPQSAAMVATSGLDQPSMDLPLMIRAIETALRVTASSLSSAR